MSRVALAPLALRVPERFDSNRHIHDHYRLLLDAAAPETKSSAPLVFSYDTRSRNVAAETSRQAALDSYVELDRRLRDETAQGKKLPANRRMKMEAVTPVIVELETTWAREVRCQSCPV